MKNDKLSKNKGVERLIKTKNTTNKKFKKKVFLREQKRGQNNIDRLREARLHRIAMFALKIMFFSIMFGFFVYILILISHNKEEIGDYISEHSLKELLSPKEEVATNDEALETEWDQTVWLTIKALDRKLDSEINDPKNFNIYQDIPEEIRKDIPLTKEEFISYVGNKKQSFCNYVSNVYNVYYYANNQPLALELVQPFISKEECMQEGYYTADNLYEIYMAIHNNFINTTFKLNPIIIEKIHRAKVVQYHRTYNVIYNLPPFLKSSKQITVEEFTNLVSDSYRRKLYCIYSNKFITVYNQYMKDKVIDTNQTPCSGENFDVSIEYRYYTTIFNTLYVANSKVEGSGKNKALTTLLDAEVPLD